MKKKNEEGYTLEQFLELLEARWRWDLSYRRKHIMDDTWKKRIRFLDKVLREVNYLYMEEKGIETLDLEKDNEDLKNFHNQQLRLLADDLDKVIAYEAELFDIVGTSYNQYYGNILKSTKLKKAFDKYLELILKEEDSSEEKLYQKILHTVKFTLIQGARYAITHTKDSPDNCSGTLVDLRKHIGQLPDDITEMGGYLGYKKIFEGVTKKYTKRHIPLQYVPLANFDKVLIAKHFLSEIFTGETMDCPNASKEHRTFFVNYECVVTDLIKDYLNNKKDLSEGAYEQKLREISKSIHVRLSDCLMDYFYGFY